MRIEQLQALIKTIPLREQHCIRGKELIVLLREVAYDMQ